MTFTSITLEDGRRLSFDDLGDEHGHPVLYFHGAGGSALARPPAADDIVQRQGVRLISVERPGIGGSDPLPRRRLGMWPSDVERVADHLGIDRFSVLGWSAGGPHALACAAALPQRVVSCGVLFGAVAIGWPGWEAGVVPELAQYCQLAIESPALLREVVSSMASDPEAFSLMFFERDPSSAPLLADEAVVAQVRADVQRAFAQGPDAMLDDCILIYSPWGFDPGAIRVPVALVYGSEDETCPISWGEHLAARIPGASLLTLEGVGHNHGYDADAFGVALDAVRRAAAEVTS